MIVLHGTWVEGRFFFWAESDRLRLRKGEAKKATLPSHPFQTSKQELINLLNLLQPGLDSYEYERLIAQLPSFTTIPKASSGFILENAEEFYEDSLRLKPWKVQCIGITAKDALLFLSLLPEEGLENGERVSFGTDLRFWSAVSKFILELVARQRFIPSIVTNQKEIRTRWKPILNHEMDAERLSAFSESMPPEAGALSKKGEVSYLPRTLIMDFINEAMDSIIRGWLIENYRNEDLDQENLVSIFLDALISEDPRLKCTPRYSKMIEESVESWVTGIQEPKEERDLLTCFRLEPPDSDRHKWTLSFHLQASWDRSLLLPVELVWNGSRKTLEYLNHRFENPQERLLQDLAQAVRLFSPIQKGLRKRIPIDCKLSTEEAYGFLKEGAFLLKEGGYGIFLPSWWKERRGQFGVHLNIKAPNGGKRGFSLQDLVEFDWKVAIGDEVLSLEEFEKLAQLKVPLVRIRGKWIEVSPEQIQSTLRLLDRTKDRGMEFSEAMRIGISGLEDGLPITNFTQEGWLSDFFAGGERGRFRELEKPEGFRGDLRPYQNRGLSWLAFLKERGFGACLADDMGLGKTIQLIALLLYDKERGDNKRPVLLICPTSVVGNWKKETQRFAPGLKVVVHHGASRLTGKDFEHEVKTAELVISTYSLVHRDQENLSRIEWRGVVLDEAQNIKNPFTKQAQSARSLRTGYRIALTGTPIENRLTELWSIMEFLNPGYLGSLNRFKTQFAIPIERYKHEESSKNLRGLIQPFILRRLKTDKQIIKDLPEKFELKVYCTLSQEQATLYKAVTDSMLQEIEEAEGIKRKGMVLSAITKLKQICNHPSLFLHEEVHVELDRSGKLSRLKEMLEEVISQGDKALVFTQFAKMGHLLKRCLQQTLGKETLFLYGGVPRKKRDEMIRRFQEESPPIFILSLKAGGLGLNLTRANHVFHFDRWWNPAVEDQATDRAFRIGQRRDVEVHKFVCVGTFEERIDEMIEEKKELSQQVIGVGEGWITELSNESLREIFTLREDAIQNG